MDECGVDVTASAVGELPHGSPCELTSPLGSKTQPSDGMARLKASYIKLTGSRYYCA
jgi:hypothetical protein